MSKTREEMKRTLENIPNNILANAYCVDICKGVAQIEWDKHVYNMYNFKENDDFLYVKINGITVVMETPPAKKVYDWEA